MVNYALLVTSALMFSSAQMCSKFFQRACGSGVRTTITNSLFTSIVVCLSMFVIGGFSVHFSWFSMGMTTIHSLNSFVLLYFGLKAFEHANLSVYSMFLMMGSIVIPSTFSIIVYNEPITVPLIISFVLIFTALYLGVEKGTHNKKAVFYYAMVFLLNGLAGVISKIHQAFPDPTQVVDTQSFLFWGGALRVVICLIAIVYLAISDKQHGVTLKGWGYAFSGGLLNAIGNYLNLLVLIYINVAVHSVVTTASMLAFSALLSRVVMKDKLTERQIMALILAICAAVLTTL